MPSFSLVLRSLLTTDIYAFDFKLNHIAKHVQLPSPPVIGDQSHLPPEQRLPPLLNINLQLPLYPVRRPQPPDVDSLADHGTFPLAS